MGAQQTAIAVADKIIRLSLDAEQPLTPMQVQKLTYFAHAWMLGLGHGSLFQDAVEAWQYGPVIRAVYHALKHHGSHPIRECLQRIESEFSPVEEGIITEVWLKYGNLQGWELSSLTHAVGSPWHQVQERAQGSQIIHNHIIERYYSGIAQRTTNAVG